MFGFIRTIHDLGSESEGVFEFSNYRPPGKMPRSIFPSHACDHSLTSDTIPLLTTH